MLTIRLQRAGRKKSPFYHIVIAEKSRPVKGRFIERVGYYNPVSTPKDISLQGDRIEHWISVGAIPSETVAGLCVKNGIPTASKFIKKRLQKPSKKQLEEEQKAKEEAEQKKQKEEEEAQKKKEAEDAAKNEKEAGEEKKESDSAEKE